jgi:hypothetical protein
MAMGGPRFTILARIDDLHFIAACPHGVAHLTWEKITLRLAVDELGAISNLMERAVTARTPSFMAAEGRSDLCVVWQPPARCELQVGAAVLRLPPGEFRRLAALTQEAKHRLDDLVASGAWAESEPQEAPSDPFQELKRILFSRN